MKALFAMILLCVASNAWSGDDELINKSDNDLTATTGDIINSVGGDKSKALGIGLSYGMGDVDLNEGENCMGSEQGANIIWGSQKMTLNAWCAALFYDSNGRHERAAAMRCTIESVVDTHPYYGDVAACISGENLAEDDAEPPESRLDDIETEHHMIEQQHVEQIQQLEEEIQQLKEEPPQVVQTPGASNLERLLREDAERRARARRILESKETDEDG